MDLRDLTKTATGSLNRNKSRSLLTILGIVIGVAAVILMLSVGQSAEGLILNQVADLGSDLVFAEPSSGQDASGPPDPFVEQSITMDDVEALQKSPFFSTVAGILLSSLTVNREEQSQFVQIVGTTEAYIDIFPADLASGRWIDETDVSSAAKIAVLGKTTAEDLFGDQEAVGQKFKIKNTTFRVVGVFEEQGSRFFQNLDERVNIPVTTMQRDLLGVDNITYLTARAIGDIEIAKEEMRFILRDEHDIDNPEGLTEKDNFLVTSQSDAEETIGVIGNVLTILLSSIAAISLVVGGIGIMNIMLVSVTERTKEIGLRKSVGATYREILRQFLLESVMLTLTGGIIGIMIGVGFSILSAQIVKQFVDGWQTVVSVPAIVLGVVVATIVGMIFGIYPARRAARLDPIEALRYE